MKEDKKKFFVSQRTFIILCLLAVIGIFASIIITRVSTGHL